MAAKDQAALAIPFRLEKPSLAREAFVREGCEHRLNPFRLRLCAKLSLGLGRQAVQGIAIRHSLSHSQHWQRRRAVTGGDIIDMHAASRRGLVSRTAPSGSTSQSPETLSRSPQ